MISVLILQELIGITQISFLLVLSSHQVLSGDLIIQIDQLIIFSSLVSLVHIYIAIHHNQYVVFVKLVIH